MEALAAIGLASNVAQFVEYAIQFTKLAHKLASGDGGAIREHEGITAITNSMAEAMKEIDQTSADTALNSLASQCLQVAADVQGIINDLSNRADANLIRSLHKAGKTSYKQKEIQTLSDLLSNMRAQVSHHLLTLIRAQQLSIKNTLETLVPSAEEYHQRFAKSLQLTVDILQGVAQKLDSTNNIPGPPGHKSISNFNKTLSSSRLGTVAQEQIDPYIRNVEELISQKKESILRSLYYEQLREREFAITDAHTKTFQWVFGANTKFRFREWLREKNGIYWIAGKAGSGKSTLMKYIIEQHATNKALREWAGSAQLVIARHFFWSPGTAIQKSQEGLFRAILFQILSQRPEIIEKVCAERFRAPYAESFGPWSRRQLMQALESLGAIDDPRFRTCVFIDGLDEYQGDHTELMQIIQRIGSHPHVKICAASRPWLDFMDAFDSSPWKLYVHELTQQDMYYFVKDTLCESPKFKRLQSSNKFAAPELIEEITKKAQGVFLWTFLVVQSLLRGLRDEDGISELRRRVQLLPTDLSDYFDRMFESIEDVYQKRVSRLFLTLSLARTTFPVLTFFYLNFDDEPMAEEPLSFLHEWPDVDMDEVEVLITEKKRLIAKCKDLIHISPEPDAPVLFTEKVGFLHRTVVDYIQTEEVSKKLLNLAGQGFEPRIVLLQANLGQLRSLLHLHRLTYIRPRLHQWILGCLYYAYLSEIATGKAMDTDLDELGNRIEQHFSRWSFSHAMDVLFRDPDIKSFLELTCICDLALYVKRKVPNCAPARLNKLAPRWQHPTRIIQSSGFEIANLDAGEEKRLVRLAKNVSCDTDHEHPVKAPGDGTSPISPTSVAKTVSFSTQQPKLAAPPKRLEKFMRRVKSVFR
ncbi:hypothetical protein N8I77_000445 [Diaporthe amygdali]|uniref:NACHT domain-containing protein n=1 Tax=Phomopsis amygdali TaxID=1214568 RepID=A0AAD9SM63_PHOAM|nr:hypothetical protein N8I77_000445 [Diaporthe amygdali]